MNQIVLNHLKEYEGLSQTGKIVRLAGELVTAGVIRGINSKRGDGGFNITYLIGDKCVFTSLFKEKTGESYFTIFDRNIYDKYLSTKGNVTIVTQGSGFYKVRLYNGEAIQEDLHRLVIKESGQSLDGDLVVDHVFMSPFINTLEALRPCTPSQNTRHSKRSLRAVLTDIAKSGEPYAFIYDLSVDFTNTWYAYVLHKMLGIGTWEDIREYNIDYIKRNKVDDANWYSDLSVWIKTYMSQEFANESWYKAITAF